MPPAAQQAWHRLHRADCGEASEHGEEDERSVRARVCESAPGAEDVDAGVDADADSDTCVRVRVRVRVRVHARVRVHVHVHVHVRPVVHVHVHVEPESRKCHHTILTDPVRVHLCFHLAS